MRANPPRRKTVSSHYIGILLASLKQHGHNADSLLAQHNFKAEQFLANSHNPAPIRLPYHILSSLVRHTWKTLDDENLGLADKRLPMGALNYAGQLAVGAGNLGQALGVMFGFYNYIESGLKIHHYIDDDEFVFEIDMRSPKPDFYHMLTDFIMAGVHRFCCWLTGKQIILKAVTFNFSMPSHSYEYGLIYSCPLVFDASTLSMRFSREFLKLPVVQNTQELAAYISESPKGLLLNPVDDDSYTIKVKRYIETFRGKELPTFEKVAAGLHMVPKTLRSHLKTEGITYQKIKDVMRQDWAIHCLNQPHYSIASIAEEVGFTETGAFVRAFKSWTEMTPSVYRNKVLSLNS